MLILKGLKNISDSKKAYKNYEKEEKYENKFDKFISGFSTPEVIDFGNEEKNEKYYKLAKQSRMRANKINLISLAIGMTAGIVSGIICFYKKNPDKIDKISTISLITTAASLFIGNIVSIPDKTKKYKEQ